MKLFGLKSDDETTCVPTQYFKDTPEFKKRPNFSNSAPTSKEGALQLLSAPSGRF
jgi:hypothetical protein